MKIPYRNLYLLALILFCFSCDGNYPNDPENTLKKVTNGEIRIGYSVNKPWVVKSGEAPSGLEPELLQAFAKTLPARIKWVKDTEQNLFEKLEKRELHIVIAGLTKDNPWKKKISFTRPYYKQHKKKHVMAVARGENAFILKLEKFLHQQEHSIKEKMEP